MKQLRNWLVLAALISSAVASATRAQQSQPPSSQVLDLKSADGTLLKATYFSAGKPGPGVLLFHQTNRTRRMVKDLPCLAAQKSESERLCGTLGKIG